MLSILICDDDPHFAMLLSEKIRALPSYSAKNMNLTCLTDMSVLDESALLHCDLLFLDIDLGEQNGLSLARKLRAINTKTVLIFVTNFKEYAPEGYEVDAFRYLAKSELDNKLSAYFEDALSVCRRYQQKVNIFCKGETVPLSIQALEYIESLGHEQCLHLIGLPQRQLITRTTMNELEEMLAPRGFLRIHKGFLVNMAYLQSLRSTVAVLSTGNSLPVGARRYQDTKKIFVEWQAQQIW